MSYQELARQEMEYRLKYYLDRIANIAQYFKIYGGQTEGDLNDRLNQHKRDEPHIYTDDMNIYPIYTSGYHYVINEGEEILINALDKICGRRKCMNKYNENGTIKQTAGYGVNHQKGDKHTLYIIHNINKIYFYAYS